MMPGEMGLYVRVIGGGYVLVALTIMGALLLLT